MTEVARLAEQDSILRHSRLPNRSNHMRVKSSLLLKTWPRFSTNVHHRIRARRSQVYIKEYSSPRPGLDISRDRLPGITCESRGDLFG